MSSSVGTKPKKKQPASLHDSQIVESRELEQSLLALEACCSRILDASLAQNNGDEESRYWHQRFENIVSPISLALAECKGPRKFHYHYKRREDDESVLHPVMENAIDILARVCAEALAHCHNDLSGMHENDIAALQNELERCIHNFMEARKALL